MFPLVSHMKLSFSLFDKIKIKKEIKLMNRKIMIVYLNFLFSNDEDNHGSLEEDPMIVVSTLS